MSHLAIRVPDFSSVDPSHCYLQSHVHVLLTIPAFDPCQKFWASLDRAPRREDSQRQLVLVRMRFSGTVRCGHKLVLHGWCRLPSQMLWVVWVQGLGCVSPRIPLTR